MLLISYLIYYLLASVFRTAGTLKKNTDKNYLIYL